MDLCVYSRGFANTTAHESHVAIREPFYDSQTSSFPHGGNDSLGRLLRKDSLGLDRTILRIIRCDVVTPKVSWLSIATVC